MPVTVRNACPSTLPVAVATTTSSFRAIIAKSSAHRRLVSSAVVCAPRGMLLGGQEALERKKEREKNRNNRTVRPFLHISNNLLRIHSSTRKESETRAKFSTHRRKIRFTKLNPILGTTTPVWRTTLWLIGQKQETKHRFTFFSSFPRKKCS